MMDIGSTELLMIVIVAIVVIGPKDLPRALYKVGQVIGKAKGIKSFKKGMADDDDQVAAAPRESLDAEATEEATAPAAKDEAAKG